MTNFEKYKDEIQEIIKDGGSLAVVNGIPCHCGVIDKCKRCEFRCYSRMCSNLAIEWLYKEAKENKED